MWIQVKRRSGSLKRPALPPLKRVWLPLTVNPSFMAFKSVCMCARVCVFYHPAEQKYGSQSDACGSHSEEPCRFPWGIMGAGKQVIAWMAPNFTLLSFGEKSFLFSCSFCKKTGRKHLNANSPFVGALQNRLHCGLQQQKRDPGSRAFCPFVVSDLFQSE